MRRWLLISLLAAAACDPAERPDRGSSPSLSAVQLPEELDQLLREYERASAARDTSALVALFTPDGFLLAPGAPPVSGRSDLGEALALRTGPLRLVPIGYAAADSVAYIIGTFGSEASPAAGGKFVLALRRTGSGPWRIAADIDNPNRQ